jgi:hypothetical protein
MASRRELEALAAPEGIDSLEVLNGQPESVETLLPAQKSSRIEMGI